MGIRIYAASSLSRIFFFYFVFSIIFPLFSLDILLVLFFFLSPPIGQEQFNKTENGIISNVTRFPGRIIARSIGQRLWINPYTRCNTRRRYAIAK